MTVTATTERHDTNKVGVHPILTRHNVPVKASTTIPRTGIVCLDATGYAVNATAALNLIVVGMALETVDNSAGSSGDKTVECEAGVFAFKNSAAGDAIGVTERFKDVYLVSNDTVAKTDGSGTRSRAGKVQKIEGGLVYVAIGAGV